MNKHFNLNFSTFGLLCKRNGKIKFISVSGVTRKEEREVKSLQNGTEEKFTFSKAISKQKTAMYVEEVCHFIFGGVCV